MIARYGHSARKAFRKFVSNERKLRQNREAKNEYNYFHQDMIDTGHIENVSVTSISASREVLHRASSCSLEVGFSNKCRTVFNGSAPTLNVNSLKYCLLVAPTQQQYLLILFRFRFYKIALSGDITKMYRQRERQKSTSSLLGKRRKAIN